jgi:hypothetical protein
MNRPRLWLLLELFRPGAACVLAAGLAADAASANRSWPDTTAGIAAPGSRMVRERRRDN